MPRSLQAVSILVPLIGRGVQLLSLYDAARLRIEIELLQPLPERAFNFAYRRSHRGNIKKLRAAIERWTETRDWTKGTNALLSALVRQDSKTRSIDIDDCSRVIDNDDIVKYFEALTRFRRSPQPSFLAKVAFRFGFVAPLHLVTGVLARYEDEWGPVIDAYGRSVIRPGDAFRYSPTREFQSFIFDCWMIWGPSIPICTCPEWRGEVALQYGFGDEDNSLILRCPNPQILRDLDERNRSLIQGKQSASSDETSEPEESPVARRVRVSGILKWGPALHNDAFCSAQQAIWNDERLVLDITEASAADSIRIAGGTDEQAYARYYSAYLWVAFVICKSDNSGSDGYKPYNEKHRWRDLIPFFSHANIASADTYSFYRDQLAHSALEGVLEILRDERKPVLRFACAVDESGCGYDLLYSPPTDTTIRQTMIDLVDKLKARGDRDTREALSRLRIGGGKEPLPAFMEGDYSACALPGIVDDYFEEMDKDNPLCHELRWSLRSDRRLLKRFYADCLVSEIPGPNARDSLSHIRKNLRLKDSYGYAKQKNNYHVVVVLEGDELIGGAIATYLFTPNAGVIEYLIVQPDHRKEGVGRRLLEFTERLLHEDADKMRRILGVKANGDIEENPSDGANDQSMHETVKHHNALDWIVAELQDPYRTPVLSNQFDPFVRAHIWRKWDYQILDYPYEQPPLDKKRRPVANLMLMAKPCKFSRFHGSPGGAADSDQPNERNFEIPNGEVDDLVKAYIDVSMPDAPKKPEQEASPVENSPVQLLAVDRYLGWQEGLYVSEVLSASDPALNDAIAAYTSVFANDGLQNPDTNFRKAFQPGGLGRLPKYRYHLWALHTAVSDKKCIGMASFLTMPTAGFANYLGFVESAGGTKIIEQLVACIEEQMMRDRLADETQSADRRKDYARHRNWFGLLIFRLRNWLRGFVLRSKECVPYMKRHMIRFGMASQPDTEGPRGEWYVECPDKFSRDAFQQLYPDPRRRGFYELNVEYRRPYAGGSDQTQTGYIPLLYKQLGRTYEDDKPSIPREKFLKVVGEIYDSVYSDVPIEARKAALDELDKSLKAGEPIVSRDDEHSPLVGRDQQMQLR